MVEQTFIMSRPGRSARVSMTSKASKAVPVVAAVGALLAPHHAPVEPVSHTIPVGLTEAAKTAPSPAPERITATTDAFDEHAAPTTTYTVQSGDTLCSIAAKYYGDEDWTKVWEANLKTVPRPDLIYPGQVLVIPHANHAPGTGTDAVSAAQVTQAPETGSPESVLQKVAAQFGWTGSEWIALQQLEALEDSSYSTSIANPSSDALGMAQALGHATPGSAGSLGDEYGANYGLTTAEAVQANSGSAEYQAIWMCTYIRDTYGTPAAAVNFHLAHNYY